MRVFPAAQTRDQYLQTQIERSERKFGYCKVSMRDALRYRAVVLADRRRRGAVGPVGPVLCLGTRNGREVDLFRIALFGSRGLRAIVALLERWTHSFISLAPVLEAAGRSDVAWVDPTSAIGVEINPRGARTDVWTGSFDAMPGDWEGRFGVVFSNSFDQSHDPFRTAREWVRVTRPGGYLIFGFSKDIEPNQTDPVGNLRLADVLELFPGELILYHDGGSRAGHSQVVLRLDATVSR